jgi:hypothetical protein
MAPALCFPRAVLRGDAIRTRLGLLDDTPRRTEVLLPHRGAAIRLLPQAAMACLGLRFALALANPPVVQCARSTWTTRGPGPPCRRIHGGRMGCLFPFAYPRGSLGGDIDSPLLAGETLKAV